MYPQPTTTQTAPTRPQWQLAGRKVTQSMFSDAQRAKKAGRRVFFITAGESDLSAMSDEDCTNCGGFGHLALEMVMSGPYKNPPAGKHGNANADEEPDVLIRPAWHNNAWWAVTRQMYGCPVCSATREVIL